jgi:hypothetical protein
MQKRLNIKTVAPNALKAMVGLETYLSQCSIAKQPRNLSKSVLRKSMAVRFVSTSIRKMQSKMVKQISACFY